MDLAKNTLQLPAFPLHQTVRFSYSRTASSFLVLELLVVLLIVLLVVRLY